MNNINHWYEHSWTNLRLFIKCDYCSFRCVHIFHIVVRLSCRTTSYVVRCVSLTYTNNVLMCAQKKHKTHLLFSLLYSFTANMNIGTCSMSIHYSIRHDISKNMHELIMYTAMFLLENKYIGIDSQVNLSCHHHRRSSLNYYYAYLMTIPRTRFIVFFSLRLSAYYCDYMLSLSSCSFHFLVLSF
jgi:hypothetical protein